MGRLFIEVLDAHDTGCLIKYICKGCGLDLACDNSLLWEGVMGGDSTPALLFRRSVNLDLAGPPRDELLTTGRYSLVDVTCRGCCATLGWKYLQADKPEQQYKVDCVLLKRGELARAGAQATSNQERDSVLRRMRQAARQSVRQQNVRSVYIPVSVGAGESHSMWDEEPELPELLPPC